MMNKHPVPIVFPTEEQLLLMTNEDVLACLLVAHNSDAIQGPAMVRAYQGETLRRMGWCRVQLESENRVAKLAEALRLIILKATDTSNPDTAPMGNRLQCIQAMADEALYDLGASGVHLVAKELLTLHVLFGEWALTQAANLGESTKGLLRRLTILR